MGFFLDQTGRCLGQGRRSFETTRNFLLCLCFSVWVRGHYQSFFFDQTGRFFGRQRR
jgi:hypothetical protein